MSRSKQLPAIAEIIKNNAAFKPTLFGLIDLTKASVVLAALAASPNLSRPSKFRPSTKSTTPRPRW
jgi:hypothetical protein